MEKIDILPMGAHEYAVDVTEGYDTTHHRVTVSDELLDDLGVEDEELLVRESVAYLLERQPADALPDEVELDAVADEEYYDEITRRLS